MLCTSLITYYLNKNTPGVKRSDQELKKALLKRCKIEMGSQGPLLLIGLNIMTSLQNIVILGAQGHLMLMGSKVLIKMTRLQNIMDLEHPK